MNREEILEAIKSLAKSQGMYGRLLRSLEEAQENDPYAYEEFMLDMERQEFKDTVDMVLFLET